MSEDGGRGISLVAGGLCRQSLVGCIVSQKGGVTIDGVYISYIHSSITPPLPRNEFNSKLIIRSFDRGGILFLFFFWVIILYTLLSSFAPPFSISCPPPPLGPTSMNWSNERTGVRSPHPRFIEPNGGGLCPILT